MAERKFEDDVPEEVKGARLQEVIARQMIHGKERTQALVGQVHRVLY